MVSLVSRRPGACGLVAARRRSSSAVLASLATAAFLLAAPAAALAAFTVTPITWDVVGLDSNRPLTSGPELFPSGARVCSDIAATNVQVEFQWPDGNGSGWDFGPGDPFINLRPGSLATMTFPSIGAGDCVDAYFELRVTRSAAAYNQTREYAIVADDGVNTASSPTPRQIFVEHLVSQSRNETVQIRYGQQADQSDWAVLGGGGSMNLAVNNDYYIELTTETSTAYEQLQSFLTLSNTIFQVLDVATTYTTRTSPPSRVPVPNPGLYADGCDWEADPNSPAYLSCLATGKDGGTVVTVYHLRIISGGGDQVTLSTLIYDYSGSSFHYNADFENPLGQLITYNPANSGFSKRFVPDTIGAGGTSLLNFTITNPNPISISGYNFLDTLPAGVLVATPANASTTCGGTVTAVAGTDTVALAGGTVGAGGSCSVLVSVTAAADGTYDNISDNLFIGTADTGHNATATLVVTSTPPPVPTCDETATLALWEFPLAASATAPAPSSNLVAATAGIGASMSGNTFIDAQNNDTGGSWQADHVSTGPLVLANNEYFEFAIDTTSVDSITLDFSSRRTTQGPQNIQLYYGATGNETASTVYSIGSANTWIAQGPTVLATGLNPSGVTHFRLYVYNSSLDNNGHAVFLDGVRFRGLHCQDAPPPPPTPGVNPPTVSKSFAPDPIAPGQTSTLTFTIVNPNPATALSGIVLADVLPFGMTVVPATFGGTCTGFWDVDPGHAGSLLHSGGLLAGGASCTLTVDVTTSTIGSTLNISDPVYATESGYNTDPVTGIAKDTLTVLAPPTIVKQFSPTLVLLGVTPGNASTLSFTIANPNSTSSIGSVSFSDSLPAGLQVAAAPNATTSGCGAPTFAPAAAATTLTFSNGTIAAGGTCTVTVDITGPAGLYDNVSSPVSHVVNGVPVTNGIPAEASLQIDSPIPSIALRKQVGPGPDPDNDPWSDYMAVAVGGAVHYKITVENTGELPLANLVVSDPDVDLSGCTWPNPLPVADLLDSHIATCVVNASPAVAGSHLNTATVSADSTGGPVGDVDTALYETVSLDFSKTALPMSFTTAGQNIAYTFTVTNVGPAVLPGPVTISDPLVPGATCPALATVGNLDNFFDAGEIVACTGNYTTLATDVTNGSVTNTAHATAGGFDSPPDTVTVAGPPPPGADLAIVKTGPVAAVEQGAFATYQIVVTNNGPDAATAVHAVDTLDAGTTFFSSSIPCVEAPVGTLDCSLGNLANGASASFTVVVHVDAAAPVAGAGSGTPCTGAEDLCNTASVTSSTTDPDPSDNTTNVGTDVVAAVNVAALSIAKTDLTAEPVAPGANVTYQITVSNAGPATATDVVVHETLDPYMSFVSDTVPGGCTMTDPGNGVTTGPRLDCPLADIPNGGSSTFQVVVTLSMSAPAGSGLQDGDCSGTEDVCNSASVSSSSSDASITDNGDTEPTDIDIPPTCGNGAIDPGETCDPPSGEICNNGVDDDGDTDIDCSDPDCAVPGYQSCDAACQLTMECAPILKDPAWISANRIRVHGKYIPTTPADPVTDGFMFLVTNANGVVYEGRLLPGDMKIVGGGKLLRWGFEDRGARLGQGRRDGIYQLRLKQKREPDGRISYPFNVRIYADMSAATESRMTTQVYVGGDVGFVTAEWTGRPGAWRLTPRQAGQ